MYREFNDLKKINTHRRQQFIKWFFEDVDRNNLRHIIQESHREKDLNKQIKMLDSVVNIVIQNKTGIGQTANFGYILYKNSQWYSLKYVKEWVYWYCFKRRRA